MKKPFAKIEYKNLGLDYDYTICELQEIPDNIEVFKQDVEDLDEIGFKSWTANNILPSITITTVMLSDEEYLRWFTENVEKNA